MDVDDSDNDYQGPGLPSDPPDVYCGIYMAGVKPMSGVEKDLRHEFQQMQLYLVRGVCLEGLKQPDCRAEYLALSIISHGQASWAQLQRLTALLPCDSSLRWQQDVRGDALPPHRVTVGSWNRGLMTGLHTTGRAYPWSARVMCRVVRSWGDELSFTSCTLSRNVAAAPHKDKFNHADSCNLCLPCSEFQGGEIFVDDLAGRSQLQSSGPTGHVLPATSALQFAPRRLHATLPWGGDRPVLLAFHIGMNHRISVEDLECLKQEGANPGFLP